eukprot:366117-Chlamydomonas_euryale.AAC.5
MRPSALCFGACGPRTRNATLRKPRPATRASHAPSPQRCLKLASHSALRRSSQRRGSRRELARSEVPLSSPQTLKLAGALPHHALRRRSRQQLSRHDRAAVAREGDGPGRGCAGSAADVAGVRRRRAGGAAGGVARDDAAAAEVAAGSVRRLGQVDGQAWVGCKGVGWVGGRKNSQRLKRAGATGPAAGVVGRLEMGVQGWVGVAHGATAATAAFRSICC